MDSAPGDIGVGTVVRHAMDLGLSEPSETSLSSRATIRSCLLVFFFFLRGRSHQVDALCLSACVRGRASKQLQLWTGQKATVTEISGESFKIDWNPDQAGTSLVGLRC